MFFIGIVAKICFHYSVNLNKLINFYFPQNHDFRGNKRQFAQSHLIMKAKLGDSPILLTTKTRLLPHLLFFTSCSRSLPF